MNRQHSRQSLRQIFALPALVGLASLAGLIGALVGDGVWDLLWSMGLAIPAALFFVCLARSRLRRSD
jgi:low temperature requirement protein LtrA